MSETDEKQTKHNMIVRILSETPITYDAALFQLAISIDKETLEDNGLILLGFDFDTAEPGTPTKEERRSNKLAEIARRFPGPAGDLLSFMKSRSARDLYVGFCGAVLLGILLFKWIMRLVTGTF